MLDSETKKRIDNARNMLVGVIPNPQSQVEQITIALIYKFMDDMDAEAEDLGGTRSFFTGNYAKFAWSNLMRTGLAGHELLTLYSDAISSMPENPGIPQLFRDIFINAYLPYRSPETLRGFLKIINEFNYDHSERLGDAFEYLLSILGSQGDAGMFRTPRNIIDFMVEIIRPKLGETILDPACGTAGFLISSYKYILKNNTDNNGNSKLSPIQKQQLANSISGYDISPDMVMLSRANMYLHGFNSPLIHNYDTLTFDERWNEYADVILANPPFMSPKGGIKPHKRFSIQAKRSEVLFVDYIVEHLTPNGRAAIIVPEGIIFQGQTAYKQLRKLLVENSLVAVISLPAGVFNPYAGVKTSILLLDKSIAKSADSIAFFKVENDGFGLGAQRRPIEKNDLPQVQSEIDCYLNAVRKSEDLAALVLMFGQVVPKAKIASNGDYNLSAERYRENGEASSTYPYVALGDICEIYQPKTITQNDLKENGAYVVYGANGVIGHYDQFNHEYPEVIVTCRGATCGTLNYSQPKSWITGNAMVFSPKTENLLKDYLYQVLKYSDLSSTITGAAQPQITRQSIAPYQIPLPPLDMQNEIVAEIEGYQKVIDGARAVLDNYRPHINVMSDWPIIQLSEICSFKNGLNFDKTSTGFTVKIIGVSDFKNHLYAQLDDLDEVHLANSLSEEYLVKAEDILFVRSNGNPDLVGRSLFVPPPREPTTFSGFTIRGRIHDKRALPIFFAHFFKSRDFAEKIKKVAQGANIRNLSQGILNELKIPLPPLATQHAIVAEIEKEQALVESNKELISRMEMKIKGVLARIYGEEISLDETVKYRAQ